MIFYDFEVFKYDWLVVMINSDTKEVTKIENDRDLLEKFYKKYKNEIWVGFNNVRYDQYILKGILCGLDPKRINDHIIVKNKPGYTYSNLLREYPLIQYDVLSDLNKGLKIYEGYQGLNIYESKINFNLNRKLTKDEIKETFMYCYNDVVETVNLFIKNINEFNAHLELVKMISPLNLNNLSKTKAQLSAMILDSKKIERDDEFNIKLPNNLELGKYQYIADWYLDENNRTYKRIRPKKSGEGGISEINNQNVIVGGVKSIFGWGGMHSAIPKYHGVGYYLNIDVTSMYPSIMIEYDLLSRNCSEQGKKRYKEIYETRIKLKKEGKKKEQAPYKLVLNATYGILKDKNNSMYDPLMANMVCIYGQLFILDLIEKLEKHTEIIQANTDGVLIKLKHSDDYHLIDDVCYEWEKRTRLKLEFEEYKEVFQKDVNNYLIVDFDGNYKSKGSYVKEKSELDNDLPIINKALIEYMVNKVPIETTINSCDKLIEFQKIDKISSKYDYGMHGEKQINERVIRHFASVFKDDDGLFKVKNGKREKISNSAINCVIDNSDIRNSKIPTYLNKDFYINIANKRLEDFGILI